MLSTKPKASSVVSADSAKLSEVPKNNESIAVAGVTTMGSKTATVNSMIYSLMELSEPRQRVPQALPREAALVKFYETKKRRAP